MCFKTYGAICAHFKVIDSASLIVLTPTGVASYTFLTVDEASGEVTVSEEIDREKFTSIDNVFYVYFRV